MLTNVLQTAEFNQGQLPSNLAVTGVAGNQNINVTMTTPSFSAASWTFTDWESFDKVGIAGTAGANTITGSSQNDFITGLGGADNMNGAEGGDTYQFLTGDLVSGEVIADTGSSGTDTLKIFADINFHASHDHYQYRRGSNVASPNDSSFATRRQPSRAQNSDAARSTGSMT